MRSSLLDKVENSIMTVLKSTRPELMKAFGSVDFETKQDRTIVTYLDKLVEERLRDVLRAIDSGIGILGEEFGQEGDKSTYWLIDPIDGTESFMRGLSACRNVVCLMEDGRPVWGLMYFFVRDELWLTRQNQGVFCNGHKAIMRYRPLPRCWLDISADITDQETINLLARVRPHIADFTKMRDPSHIMLGKVDGSIGINAGGGQWDYYPRELFFNEAGAKMTNIGSDKYDYNDKNFVVCHERNFDALMKLIV